MIAPKIAINFLLGAEVVQRKLNKMYDIQFINMFDAHKHFPKIGSDFCYFIVANAPYKGQTKIFTDGEILDVKLKFNSIIPYENISRESISICQKVLNLKNEIGRKAARISKDLKRAANDEYRYKILYKILTHKEEYRYSRITHKDHSKPKLLWPTVGDRKILDLDGKLFPGTSFVVYISANNKEEILNLSNFIDSKLFKFLEKSFKTMRSPRDYIIKSIKKIDLTKNIDDDYIYKFYSLTPQEIQLIEKSVDE